MEILKIILTVLLALMALNLLIFVHELGHYWAAKWRGLRIDRFAIWFGKPIWKQRINGVEYALGWIPAGGYVALPQMASMEMIEGKSDGGEEQKPLPPISAMDKIIVAFAGPLFSFLLAVAFAFLVWGAGKPERRIDRENSTRVGWVVPNGPAWNAGLRPGDLILKVDGHSVMEFASPSQNSITWRVITSEGTNIAIEFKRGNEMQTVYAVPEKEPTKWYERKSLRKVQIGPVQPAVIGVIASNSPAALAGLKSGDEITAINGDPIYSPGAVMHLEDELTNAASKSVTLTVSRDGELSEKVLTAVKPVQPADAPPSFGILAWLDTSEELLVYPRPMQQIRESMGMIIATLDTVLSRKSDVGVQQLGGAVMIIRAYKTFFASENGWRRVLWFSVVLNVNLALLNLLPFPVLDGGHITLALVEGIRRKAVSARFLNIFQSAFAVVLIAFMLYIAFFDAGDWIRSSRNDRMPQIQFAPKLSEP